MLENIIKDDLRDVSQLSNEEVMDKLDLDEDSAEAVKAACSFYIRHNLGKMEPKKRREFNFGRRSARVTKGGAF
tara:strand:+ start:190 stop:411 length:222 start_codon:yes stop_codon:yes gene_type:complete